MTLLLPIQAWFESIAPYALDGEHQLIGWDFVSHHIRDGNTEQTIPVALKRGYIDLGSVMIRRQAFITSQAKFLPESVFTTVSYMRIMRYLKRRLLMIHYDHCRIFMLEITFWSPKSCHRCSVITYQTQVQ